MKSKLTGTRFGGSRGGVRLTGKKAEDLKPALGAGLLGSACSSKNLSQESFGHYPYLPESALTVLKGIPQLWRMVRFPIKAEDFNDVFILLS